MAVHARLRIFRNATARQWRIDASKSEARLDFGAAAVALAPADARAELRDTAATNELAGQLTLAFGGARPRVSGALGVASLDLRPFFASGQGAADKTLDYAALQRQMLPLRDLVPLDVDVDLSIDRWLGLPVDIRDAKFDLRADASGVRVPISATMASVPFSGRLDLDTAAPMPTLALRFAAKDAALGDLAAGADGRYRWRRQTRAPRPAPRRTWRNAWRTGA